MYRALFLSPMVPSTDVEATAAFLRDGLGFAVRWIGSYAICQKDHLTLHLQPAGEGIGEMALYLEVDDLDALAAALRPHLDGIRHRGPLDQDYGMRELHVALPHTQALLFIGQSAAN